MSALRVFKCRSDFNRLAGIQRGYIKYLAKCPHLVCRFLQPAFSASPTMLTSKIL